MLWLCVPQENRHWEQILAALGQPMEEGMVFNVRDLIG